jgi:heavy metal sensor kinase
MNIKSLRFKMTLRYVLALAITFVVAGLLIDRLTSRAVRGDLDDLLEVRAEGIAESIDTFWAMESEAAARQGNPFGSTSKIDNLDFRRQAQRWVGERIKDPVLVDLVVQVFDPSGGLVASSQPVPGATLLPFDALATFLSPDARFLNIVSQGPSGERARFRALTYPVAEEGRLAYVIRVLSPLDRVEAPLRALRLILFLLLPATVLLSGAVGAWLAGRTLKPVSRMVDSAREISAENLQIRLPVQDTHDEVSRLAETFNGMLERIDQGFSFQRQFWEDVAHELKTPLAIMKGEIEVALKSGDRTGDREVLASNLEEVEHLIRLIEKMLTLARLDRGGAPLEMSEVDLAALASKAVEEFRTLAEDKGIRLRFGGADETAVRGDEARLRGLLYILLDNAVKYTPAGGTVGVDVGRDANMARLAVSDTGPGIAETDLPRIFERFSRSGRAVDGSGLGSGFGLGLSIAKAVAESHGGRIEVESRTASAGAATGTTFTVLLPLAQR